MAKKKGANPQKQKQQAKRAAVAAAAALRSPSADSIVPETAIPAMLREIEKDLVFPPESEASESCPHLGAVSSKIVVSQLHRRDRSRNNALLISCDPCTLHLSGVGRKATPTTTRAVDTLAHQQRSAHVCLLL
jgi:hypothetical protein